jgi:hypothetical protein
MKKYIDEIEEEKKEWAYNSIYVSCNLYFLFSLFGKVNFIISLDNNKWKSAHSENFSIFECLFCFFIFL